jgi:phthalate 4,5-cis-dihydrodiol dehydrogenase
LTSDPVRLGVVGLGRAFALTAPAIAAHPGVVAVAAAAPRAESREAFQAAFGGRVYGDVAELVADPGVEAIYITTPHGLHRDHALAAIAAGKHVLVEKPMAVTMGDACAMIRAACAAGVTLMVGPSHSFDGPVKRAADLIATGAIGTVRMVNALYATDFLYRPRRADELNTDLGGGVVFSQAIHQVDLVRRLVGRPARQVWARTGGAWDPARPTEGAYAMMIDFEGGAFASLAYSGHAHFDGDRLMGDISELGVPKQGRTGLARTALSALPDEADAKRARGFTTLADCPQARTHEHFGQVLVFGERGDLRLTPDGVEVSDDHGRRFEAAPFRTTRAEVFDALQDALRAGVPPLQTGVWGRASLEICHALLASARTGQPQGLVHQSEGSCP